MYEWWDRLIYKLLQCYSAERNRTLHMSADGWWSEVGTQYRLSATRLWSRNSAPCPYFQLTNSNRKQQIIPLTFYPASVMLVIRKRGNNVHTFVLHIVLPNPRLQVSSLCPVLHKNLGKNNRMQQQENETVVSIANQEL